MQNRHVIFGLLLIAIAAFAQDSGHTSVNAGVFSGSVHFSAPPPELHGQTGAPYSAEETYTSVQTLADGTHITRESSSRKLYRDSAGRTRTERPLVIASRHQKVDVPMIVEITDPVERVRYTLDTVNKVAHKQAIPERDRAVKRTAPLPDAAAARPQPSAEDAPQSSNEKLEPQTMEGLQVEGTRHTIVYPTGFEGNDRPIKVVNESWWSPELEVTVLDTRNDPRFGETTNKLINIDRSEPDPSLFLPPANYTVVEEKGDFTFKWGSESQ